MTQVLQPQIVELSMLDAVDVVEPKTKNVGHCPSQTTRAFERGLRRCTFPDLILDVNARST